MTATPAWVDALETELLGGGRWADPLALGQQLDPPRINKGRSVGTGRSAALDIVCGELVKLRQQAIDRCMIFFPPQEGKSTTIGQWFPLWLLSLDPTLRIGIMSHGTNLARKRGRWVRDMASKHPALGIELRRGATAADNWETTAGGGMISVGIGSGITGNPIDVLIIDDPVRGRAEAESKTMRDAAWDWWENNGSTRLSSRGVVVLMMTRWHTDDLAGRILREEPGDWRVVSIPAVAEDDDDPLGRDVGEEFPSIQSRPKGWFHKLQKLRSPYVWNSIYQQRPTAAEGNLFKRDAWQYWELARDTDRGECLRAGSRMWPLQDCWRFTTSDLAVSTRTSSDFTVHTAWAIAPDGDMFVLDRWRGRVAEADHFEKARPLIQRWLIPTMHVEASQHSTTIAYEAGRAGLPVAKLDADKDKLSRALPAAERQQRGRIWLPRTADWLDEWLDEHADFPSAAHDDQVDTTAYAARVAAAHYVEPGMDAELERAIEASRDADGPDLMTVKY